MKENTKPCEIFLISSVFLKAYFAKAASFIPSIHIKRKTIVQLKHTLKHTHTKWTILSNCPPTPTASPTSSLNCYFPSQALFIPVPMQPSQSFYPRRVNQRWRLQQSAFRGFTIICLNAHTGTHTHTAPVFVEVIIRQLGSLLMCVEERAGPGSNERLYCTHDGLSGYHYLMVLKGPIQASASGPHASMLNTYYTLTTSIIKMQIDVLHTPPSFMFTPRDFISICHGVI